MAVDPAEEVTKIINQIDKLKQEISRYITECDTALRNLYYGKTTISDVGNLLGKTTGLLEKINKELTKIQKNLLKLK